MDYENFFVNKKINIKIKNEFLWFEKSNLEICLDIRKIGVVWEKDEKRKKSLILWNLFEFGN